MDRPELEITITDRKPLDPEGEHILRVKTVYNDRQASAQCLGFTTDELYELYRAANERLYAPKEEKT